MPASAPTGRSRDAPGIIPGLVASFLVLSFLMVFKLFCYAFGAIIFDGVLSCFAMLFVARLAAPSLTILAAPLEPLSMRV